MIAFQPELSAPYQRHSATSREAAQAIEATVQSKRQAVLDFLRERGAYGATDLEIQAWLGMDGDTERPRRWDLVRMGLVRDSGLTRATKSKRQAVVWRVVS